MSFVERNKLWLLPLLGLGVAAVGWYNVQAFSGSKNPAPAPEAPSTRVEEGAPAPAPAPAPPGEAAAPTPGLEGGGLWDDLKALATVPGDLNRLDALDSQARGVLPPSALQEGGSEVLRLPGPKVWLPRERPRPATGEAAPGLQAPDPDILIQLPEGRRVWFDGIGYREQQALEEAPWKVRRIAPRSVELQGPRGTEVKAIHPPIPTASKEGP